MLVVLLYRQILVFHLFFQIFEEFFFNVSNSYFLKVVHSDLFALRVQVFQLTIVEWTPIFELLVEVLHEDVEGVLHSLEALIFANVSP